MLLTIAAMTVLFAGDHWVSSDQNQSFVEDTAISNKHLSKYQLAAASLADDGGREACCEEHGADADSIYL